MDNVTDLPGISHVKVHQDASEHCALISLYIHHQLPSADIEKLVKAIVVMLPAIVRHAAML